MGKPTLELGTYGDIFTQRLPDDAKGRERWMARAQFRDSDGKTRPVKRHGSSEDKAKTALRKALKARSGQSLSEDLNRSSRLSKLAELYLAEQDRRALQGLRAATGVDNVRYNYETYIKPGIGELTLGECTTYRMHKFIIGLASTKPSTAALCKSVLSTMFGFAVAPHGAIDRNPMRDVGEVKRTRVRPKPKALAAEQVTAWLAAVDGDERAGQFDLPDISRLLLATGARIGEVLALHWEEIDLDADRPTVRFCFHTVPRPGVGVVRVASTKGSPDDEAEEGPGDRTLDLPQWATKLLKRRRMRTGGTGALFLKSSGKYWGQRQINREIRRIRAGHDFPKWLTSHTLGRKTVATLLEQGGATAREIADQLGHSKPSMTMDVYMARGLPTTRQAGLLEAIDG